MYKSIWDYQGLVVELSPDGDFYIKIGHENHRVDAVTACQVADMIYRACNETPEMFELLTSQIKQKRFKDAITGIHDHGFDKEKSEAMNKVIVENVLEQKRFYAAHAKFKRKYGRKGNPYEDR